MHVIEYFTADHPEYWLSRINESDWAAGQFLHGLLKDDQFRAYAGENARVLLLADDDQLVSFCTLSDRDDIASTDWMPWIGFVYTFPQYRGNRYAGRLIDYAADLAKKAGFDKVYVSTDQEGIYEKYGFVFVEVMKDRRGGDSRVYERCLSIQTGGV